MASRGSSKKKTKMAHFWPESPVLGTKKRSAFPASFRLGPTSAENHQGAGPSSPALAFAFCVDNGHGPWPKPTALFWRHGVCLAPRRRMEQKQKGWAGLEPGAPKLPSFLNKNRGARPFIVFPFEVSYLTGPKGFSSAHRTACCLCSTASQRVSFLAPNRLLLTGPAFGLQWP